MKKLLKKVLAIMLTVIMLLSAVSIHSFAALDFLRMPEIAAVEIVGEDAEKALSFSEIEYFYESLQEEFENMTDEYDFGFDADIYEIIEEYPFLKNLFNYNLSHTDIVNYDFEVTLSNGDKITVKADDTYVEYKKIFAVSAYASVSYDDYLEAKENGTDTIKLTVEGEISNMLLEGYVEPNSAVFKKEVPLVDCYIKSITPISGVPEKVYEYCDYYEIEGAKFKVVYPDGTSKILKAEKTVGFNDGYEYVNYTLNNEALYVYEYDEGILEFSYLDAVAKKKIGYYEDTDPFKSVKITDYVFDEATGLTSISYDITMNNSEVKSFTKDFTSQDNLAVFPYGILDVMDGFYIVLNPYPGDAYDSEEEYEAGYIYFNVTAGECNDSVKVEFSATQEINVLLKIIEKITEIIDMLKAVISNIFDIVLM